MSPRAEITLQSRVPLGYVRDVHDAATALTQAAHALQSAATEHHLSVDWNALEVTTTTPERGDKTRAPYPDTILTLKARAK